MKDDNQNQNYSNGHLAAISANPLVPIPVKVKKKETKHVVLEIDPPKMNLKKKPT